jgi:8-oxo-dGTP pyrophosphatase MutT (NUDIX family)
MELSEQEIISRLSQPYPVPKQVSKKKFLINTKPAAVLIPLLTIEDENSLRIWHILYTRRTELVAVHKGQVSFPGGKADPTDQSLKDTALREAYEEIDLYPNDVTLIGRLQEVRTISNYLVTPFIGLIPWPYEFRLQTNEVSHIFTIPFSWLSDLSNIEYQKRRSIEKIPVDLSRTAYYRPYKGETLWGVSALLTIQLMERLGLRG